MRASVGGPQSAARVAGASVTSEHHRAGAFPSEAAAPRTRRRTTFLVSFKQIA